VSEMLDYRDAVRLLGGDDGELTTALDGVAGGLLLASPEPVTALFGLINARVEFVRVSRRLIRGFVERRQDLTRRTRTERLEAAHAVIVLIAYFEALHEALREAGQQAAFADLELTAEEQATIAGAPAAERVTFALFAAHGLMPGPEAIEGDRSALVSYYDRISEALLRFVEGLASWERMRAHDRARFRDALAAAPGPAIVRYDEDCRRLAMDFPEVALWVNKLDHRATRGALGELQRLLREFSAGTSPDDRRAALYRAAGAALRRPVVDPAEVQAGLQVPTRDEAYVTPPYRIATLQRSAPIGEEGFWEQLPVRDNLEAALARCLTSPAGYHSPTVLLGQPGSGKSLLTEVLAARLPAADYLPVRVPLRDVAATADLQDQIESALRAATGERLDWPLVSRAADGAVPVVMLDGFDELLQATGLSQSDYLLRAAAFQQREYDQGRPVIVMVTTRTSVADRMTLPPGTVAIRLEPFDVPRIARWLEIWNEKNAGYFADRGLTPLTAGALAAHGDLAGQPLLLLMLALYDATGNALQRHHGLQGSGELYERLIVTFAHREVLKDDPVLADRTGEESHALAWEVSRLSLVAFAMFNRNSQWVTEADLAADLTALLEPQAKRTPTGGLRAPLGAAESALGRFFFIHRSQAIRDDKPLATYEFLHATFGEYLVARLTVLVLRQMGAHESATRIAFGHNPVSDDLLHALLSFTALTARAPVLGFLRSLIAEIPAPERPAIRTMLIRLFRAVHKPRASQAYAEYRPQPPEVPARHAAYSANLLLLTVCAAERVSLGELYGTVSWDAGFRWRRQTTLLRSQLRPEELKTLVESLGVERRYTDGLHDVVLTIDPAAEPPPVDLYWTYNAPAAERGSPETFARATPGEIAYWSRRNHFLCRIAEDITQHTIEPILDAVIPAMTGYVDAGDGRINSGAHTLLKAWFTPLADAGAADRTDRYRTAAAFIYRNAATWPARVTAGYAILLLDRVMTDRETDPATAAEIITALSTRPGTPDMDTSLVRCATRFLGLDPDADHTLATIICDLLDAEHRLVDDAETVVEAWVRLVELGLPEPRPATTIDDCASLIASIAAHRPDLQARMKPVLAQISPQSRP